MHTGMNQEELSISIGPRRIGSGEPVFVIAEASINHNGSVQRAKELIDAAVMAGADAIKFQKRSLADVYQKKVLDNPNSAEQRFQYLIPLLKEFELADEVFVELEAYAGDQGIMFLVNPWDKKSLADVERLLDIPFYKVGSPDFTNNELLEAMAETGKSMILSTGMSEMHEIEAGVEFVRSLGVPFALLHCNSTYPAPLDEINLKFMDTLSKFKVPVGYSGHERGTAVSIGAVARGACIIERHITVDRTLEGPDHKASLLPEEFAQMVAGIREVERAVGSTEKKLSRGEIMNRELLAKSIVAKTFIADGVVITREMLTTKSPAKGLSPQRMNDIVGVVAQRDIFEGEALTEDDVNADTILSTFDSSDIPWAWGPVVRWKDYESYLKYEPKLFEFHLSDKDLDEAVPVGKFSQQVIVHAPEYMNRHYLNPAAEDKDERELAIATLQRSINVAKELGQSFQGVPKFIIHPGGITLTPSKHPKKLLDLFADTLSRLDAEGVEVLPENLPPRPWVFGGEWTTNIFLRGAEIKEFLDSTGYKMCFDTSHGAGTVDFASILEPLAGYQYTMVPEIWQGHLHGGKGFLHAMNRLKGYMK